jgi:hypothetical protein
MSGESDVEVEQCADGWVVRRARKRLKRFADGQRRDGLLRACEWGWDYASQRGLTAWLKQGDRRSRINFSPIEGEASGKVRRTDDE